MTGFERQVSLFDYLNGHKRYVRQIEYEDAKPFILGIHYARRMPCIQYAFGYFEGGVLVGIVTYGQPPSPSLCIGLAGEKNKKNVLELNRLVFLPGYNGNNRASYLVGQSLKMLPTHTFVVSYADYGGWGHIGYIYQATNFLYTGMTKERTDKYSGDGHPRHYKQNESKRQLRTAKHRYVYLVGNRREKREMKKELRYSVIKEYPKGETRRYDTEDPRGK